MFNGFLQLKKAHSVAASKWGNPSVGSKQFKLRSSPWSWENKRKKSSIGVDWSLSNGVCGTSSKSLHLDHLQRTEGLLTT